MKKIILLFFICLFGYSQEIKVSGSFSKNVINNNGDVENVKIKKYKIYLLEGFNSESKSKKIFDSKNGDFNILISKVDIDKYAYIEFISSNKQTAIYTIESLSNINYLEVKEGDGKDIYYENYYSVGKPAVYLYPKVSTEVTVKNNFKGQVINTYPLYNNGWKVVAEPTGELFNLADNRKYNYLFWDGAYSFTSNHFNYKDGFYVKKKDNIGFLQEKLELLGLNNTEINDFIVYWLPELNKNEENFIHFWVNDNIDNSSILTINPKPDTLIRVFMEFKVYLGENKLPEQQLVKSERIGFTVVEWGGSNVDKPIIK